VRNSAGLAIILVRGIAEQRGGYAVSQKIVPIVPIRHKPRKFNLISESIIVHFNHQTWYFCTEKCVMISIFRVLVSASQLYTLYITLYIPQHDAILSRIVSINLRSALLN
jgi:hypothetical protein